MVSLLAPPCCVTFCATSSAACCPPCSCFSAGIRFHGKPSAGGAAAATAVPKPGPKSTKAEKELFVVHKYHNREMLPAAEDPAYAAYEDLQDDSDQLAKVSRTTRVGSAGLSQWPVLARRCGSRRARARHV